MHIDGLGAPWRFFGILAWGELVFFPIAICNANCCGRDTACASSVNAQLLRRHEYATRGSTGQARNQGFLYPCVFMILCLALHVHGCRLSMPSSFGSKREVPRGLPRLDKLNNEGRIRRESGCARAVTACSIRLYVRKYKFQSGPRPISPQSFVLLPF